MVQQRLLALIVASAVSRQPSAFSRQPSAVSRRPSAQGRGTHTTLLTAFRRRAALRARAPIAAASTVASTVAPAVCAREDETAMGPDGKQTSRAMQGGEGGEVSKTISQGSSEEQIHYVAGTFNSDFVCSLVTVDTYG